jgi:hypothetical protein
MTRAKNDTIKPLQKIEISVTEILIVSDGAFKPYIQTFHYEPENIALASLGSVLGIFEIEDQSEDSAYIVNFLASIVKKEYFAHPKRAAIEGLDATLRKINLALSELIKRDNTAWLGKLNATLCVFEKNNVHFSVSGKAKTLLIRNGILSDISEGLAEESNIHPLKTFTEVSSGRLKSDDKIILTTPGLFEIFSPAEIQKNAQRFSNEKFSQFIKTALVNQLFFGSTIIVDIFEARVKEPILKKSPPIEKAQDIPNAFSQSTFYDKRTVAQSISEAKNHEQTEITQQESAYTDSKTGHIYVQGDVPQVQPNETWIAIKWFIKQTATTIAIAIKKFSLRLLRSIHDFTVQKITSIRSKTQIVDTSSTPEYDPIPVQETLTETSEVTHIHVFVSSTSQWSPSAFWEHIRKFMSQISIIQGVGRSIMSVFRAGIHFLTRIFPRFYGIRNGFSKLSSQQKKYAITALFAIFVVPFLIVKFQEQTKTTPIPVENKPAVVIPRPLASDKNIHNIASTQSVLANSDIVTTVILKDTLFAITKTSVIILKDPQDTKAFPLPSTLGSVIIRATVMNDLNTLFLLTDTGKIVSFMPINHTFSDNTLILPDVSHIADIATYLTYLYVLDTQSDSLMRYPRATGGFGDGSPWLKEVIDIQNTDAIAINEDFYLAQTDHILAFNKGRRDPIAFETSATPIVFSKVFTQAKVQFLYVLDAVNGRIIRFEKSGAIVDQYANDALKGASSLSVDEPNKKAYFTTSSGVFSLGLE